MSWVPSPSPRLSASYRDVGMPMMTVVPAPSGLSFGMPTVPPALPYQPPRPQVRQGSFTPAPSSVAAAQTRGVSPSLAHLPARLGSLNQIPYTAPALVPGQNRSWTPLPMPSVLAGLEKPQNIIDDRLSHSLTALPTEMIAQPPHPVPINGASHHPPDSQFTHRPRQSSFSQTPVSVILNVYYQRSVNFDEHGRAIRRAGGDELGWRQKLMKDVLGVYHVGLQVHGTEYGFGNYRAPGSRQLGGPHSGVFSHEPQRPGPHCVFKQSETLGITSASAAQIEDICAAMGSSDWHKHSYNKFNHNCVDFVKVLSMKLGAGEVPAWCYRGQAMGKALGLGGPDPDDSMETGYDSGVQSPAVPMDHGSLAAPIGHPPQQQLRPLNSMAAAMEFAQNSGTYVAPPPVPAPGSLAGTYVAPPMGRGPSYVAPPMAPIQMSVPPPGQAPPGQAKAAVEALTNGCRVSVSQNNGTWATGKVVQQDYDHKFTILYDTTWSTEVNVASSRIVPLPPEAAGDGLPQALSGAVDLSRTFQGLASAGGADSILEPLKQHGISLGGIGGGISYARPRIPSFAAPAAAQPMPVPPSGFTTMGGFPPQRSPLAMAPSYPQPVSPMVVGSSPQFVVPQSSASSFSRMAQPIGRDALGATWRY
jgi:hypothetical protein